MPRPAPSAGSRKGTGRRPTFDWTGFLVLCGIYVVVAWLWHTPWVFPLKLFVVLLHEMSHGIAAVATGGRILEMQITADEGGHCVSAGGLPFVVVSAGYLGSLAFGVSLLLVATRTRLSPWVAGLLGTLVAVMAFRFMPGWTFGKGFAMLAGASLATMALVPPIAAEIALRVIGVTSCLYVFLDIKEDVLDRDHPMSDASILADMTGIPALAWGLLWIGISVVVTAIAAKWAVLGARATPKPPKAAAKTK